MCVIRIQTQPTVFFFKRERTHLYTNICAGREAGRQADKEDYRAKLTEVAGFPFIAFPLTVTLHTVPVWQTPAVMLADVVDATVVHQVTAVQLKADGWAGLHHRDRVQLLSLDHNLLHASNIPVCIWTDEEQSKSLVCYLTPLFHHSHSSL